MTGRPEGRPAFSLSFDPRALTDLLQAPGDIRDLALAQLQDVVNARLFGGELADELTGCRKLYVDHRKAWRTVYIQRPTPANLTHRAEIHVVAVRPRDKQDVYKAARARLGIPQPPAEKRPPPAHTRRARLDAHRPIPRPAPPLRPAPVHPHPGPDEITRPAAPTLPDPDPGLGPRPEMCPLSPGTARDQPHSSTPIPPSVDGETGAHRERRYRDPAASTAAIATGAEAACMSGANQLPYPRRSQAEDIVGTNASPRTDADQVVRVTRGPSMAPRAEPPAPTSPPTRPRRVWRPPATPSASWQRARHIQIYASTLVPGPLQAREYREAVRSCPWAREGGHDEADLPGGVKATVLLEEGALHHQVGSPDVMSAQITHLMALLNPGTGLSLGLIPLSAARTPAELPLEPFVILDDHEVVLPLTTVPIVLGHHAQTFRYKAAFAQLHRLALTGATVHHHLSRLVNSPIPA